MQGKSAMRRRQKIQGGPEVGNRNPAPRSAAEFKQVLNSAGTERPNQGQGQSTSSPRKRKRSPGPIANHKVQRVGNGSNFDEEIDDLDLLCTAALEQYDLTQTVSSSQIPEPVPKSQIPLSRSISSKEKGNTAGTPFVAQNNFSQPVGGRFNASSHSHHLSAPQSSEAERVKILQEQNYTKDGENKVLRGEKERLLEELRKKEEQLKMMQTTLLAEKQTQERQLVKERDSLATKLQFKEQEVVNLREKNTLLEQQKSSTGFHGNQSPGARVSPPAHLHRSQPQKTSSSKRTSLSRGKPHPSMPNKDTEFLSTESFMPLSQLNLDGGGCGITPVHVGPRQAPCHVRRGSGRGSGSHAKATRSRSVSPNPMDLKKMKKRSVSDRGDDVVTTSPRGSAESAKPRDDPMTASSSSLVSEEGQGLWGSPLVHAGRRSELDGAQILLLLVKQNLLRPPFHCHHMHSEQQPLQDNSACIVSSDATQSDVLLNRQSGEREIARGLLSLLHLEPKGGGASSFPPIASHSTPTLDRYTDTQRQYSDSDQSGATTPTRHAHHLLPYKSHTVGRLNLAKSRIRHSSGLLTSTRKPHSTANTPIKAPPATDSASSSLLSSINASSLQTHIGNLLVSSEISRFSSLTKGPVLGSEPGRTPDPITEILKQVGHLIMSYHREQSAKVASSTNSHLSSEGSGNDSIDTSSLVLSPRSSAFSKSSSDLVSPLLGDQKLVTHALEILEVLATYSSAAREQILLQPPEFIIDSRPSSSLDVHQIPPSLNVSLEGVNASSGRAEWAESGRGDVASNLVDVSLKLKQGLRNGEIRLATTQWKNLRLSHFEKNSFSLSKKVWMEGGGGGESAASDVTPLTPSSSARGSGCGHLFSVLMDLPVPPWKESNENTLSCFKILTALAESCGVDSMTRFGQLLQKETILICLEKEDPHLTFSTLSLLSLLVRSEDMVAMLCTYGIPCVLLTCYQCLLDPPSSAGKELACNIQLQIVRLISQIAICVKVPLALYGKCSCSEELLNSLVSLLEKMVDGVHQITQWTPKQLCLVYEAISLVFRISISDNYFDTHRDPCEHMYAFVFNRLAVLMESCQPPREDYVSMVNELLSYCEELDDSS